MESLPDATDSAFADLTALLRDNAGHIGRSCMLQLCVEAVFAVESGMQRDATSSTPATPYTDAALVLLMRLMRCADGEGPPQIHRLSLCTHATSRLARHVALGDDSVRQLNVLLVGVTTLGEYVHARAALVVQSGTRTSKVACSCWPRTMIATCRGCR